MKTNRPVSVFVPVFVFILGIHAAAQQSSVEFLSFEAAQPVLREFATTLPPELGSGPDAARWSAWVKKQDAAIRQRLEQGEEDTLTNLLRFGVTYTDEYQIDREYLSAYGKSTLVNSFAENRANALVRALSAPGANEGMQEMRAFLIHRGYSFATAQERARVKQHLLDNLAHMRDEFAQFREKLQSADASDEAQLYAQRGISLDTNLWPDYALDRSMGELVKAGLLKVGSVSAYCNCWSRARLCQQGIRKRLLPAPINPTFRGSGFRDPTGAGRSEDRSNLYARHKPERQCPYCANPEECKRRQALHCPVALEQRGSLQPGVLCEL